MSVTWVGGICAALILVGFFIGYQRGLLKTLVSVLLMGLSFAAVWFLNPYVSSFIEEHTQIRTVIQDGCEDFVSDKLNKAVESGTDYLTNGLQSGASALVETLELPGLLSDQLVKSDAVVSAAENMASGGVSSFSVSVSRTLADIAMECLSFIVSFLLVSILIRVFTFAVNLFSRIPVISGINKAAGGILGAGEFLVFIWLAMMAATLLCNVEIGQKALERIQADTIADTLYRWNPILRFFEGFTLK